MLSLLELRNAAARYRTALSKSLTEARIHQLPTVFLCHSHLDEDIVKGLMVFWKEAGWEVYVDWEDASMPEPPHQRNGTSNQEEDRGNELFRFLIDAQFTEITLVSVGSRFC